MKYTLTLLILLISLLSFSQKVTMDDIRQMDSTARAKYFQLHDAKIDSLAKIDYLDYNYTYLDKDFRINIDSDIFNSTINTYEFISEHISSYKDSLAVALMAEFNDWDQLRVAELRILYSWQRLGYHTWQSKEEAQEFAAQFELTHPWRMREFLIDEANHHQEIKKFYKQLLKKVEKETGRADLDTLSRKEFLNVAMRNNPQRIDDFRKLQQEVRKQHESYKKEHSAKEETQID